MWIYPRNVVTYQIAVISAEHGFQDAAHRQAVEDKHGEITNPRVAVTLTVWKDETSWQAYGIDIFNCISLPGIAMRFEMQFLNPPLTKKGFDRNICKSVIEEINGTEFKKKH